MNGRTASLRPVLRVLVRAHRMLNDALFAGTLGGDVVLTTPPCGRSTRAGAYRAGAWQRAAGAPAEVAIFAEGLHRALREVLLTLLQMMVHQANAEAGVRDSSRSGTYLNRRYAEAAHLAGLCVFRLGEGKGWGVEGLDPAHAWANAVLEVATSILGAEFDLVRLPPPPAKPSRVRVFGCACDPPVEVRSGRALLPWRCVACGELVGPVDGVGADEGVGEGQGRVAVAAQG